MQSLYIELRPIDKQRIELRYHHVEVNEGSYEPQIVDISSIQSLIAQSERDFYVSSFPDLVNIGQQLFIFLDSPGRYLTRAIESCQEDGLILAIDTGNGDETGIRLSHLPWEVLHDGSYFLVDRLAPSVVPLRWTKSKVKPREPQNRALRILFMATSPEPPIEPILQFEREEAQILETTQEIPLYLQVEESGCLDELNQLWRRYQQDYFDIFHLTGHASINQTDKNHPFPYFVTENLDGTRRNVTAQEIAKALYPRFPQLVFLSGCRTAQNGNEGTFPSMAQELINQGIRSVIGWGYPVADISATKAASTLYSELAAGYGLTQAIHSTYRKLREDSIPDWHFFRLYIRGDCPNEMVVTQDSLTFQTTQTLKIEDLFLDPNHPNSPRVVTRENFVGRRRSLQRCLKYLRNPPGILIHGMGGVGKTTLAQRLLERLTAYGIFSHHQPEEREKYYDIVFNHRQIDPDKLIRSLQDIASNAGLDILKGDLPFGKKLTNFFKFGLESLGQSFIFVLDDFEVNLEPNANGEYILKSDAVRTLIPLLGVIRTNGLNHRVIITCRYNFTLADERLNNLLKREHLIAFEGADLRKKLDRLDAFNNKSDISVDLQQQAINLADGNPRLLEWLGKVLISRLVNHQPLFQEIADKTGQFRQKITAQTLEQPDELRQRLQQQIEDKVREFRENILAKLLLEQQSQDLRRLLSLALVFRLPVPRPVFARVCQVIPNAGKHIRRASDLGLLEVTPEKDYLRVPRILETFLDFPADNEGIYQTAARALYQSWWPSSDILTEPEQKEIYRLARLAKDIEIAVEVAVALTNQWLLKGRYTEIKTLCQEVLTLSQDYRILYNLAYAEQFLGGMKTAKTYIQEAFKLCPREDEEKKALIIAFLAGLLRMEGNLSATNYLCQEVEKMSDTKGKAEALGALAVLKVTEQDFEKAESYIQQALDIHQRLENKIGIAQIFNCWGIVKTGQGLIDEAFSCYQQAIDQFRSLGKLQELASTLLLVGGLHLRLEQVKESTSVYQEAINLVQKIGENVNKLQFLLASVIVAVSQGNMEQGLTFLQQSLDLAQKEGNNLIQSSLLVMLSSIYMAQEQDAMAENTLLEALKIAETTGDILEQIEILLTIGIIKGEQKESNDSLVIFQKGLALCESMGANGKNVFNIYKHKFLIFIGFIYIEKEEINSAVNCLEQALAMFEEIMDIESQLQVLSALGELELNDETLNKAIFYAEQILNIYEYIEDNNLKLDNDLKLNILLTTGNIYLKAGEKNLVTKCIEKAKELSENTENIETQIEIFQALSSLAKLEYDERNISNAISYLQQSLEIGEKIDNNCLRMVALVRIAYVYSVYDEQENYTLALEYLQKALTLFRTLDKETAEIIERDLEISEDLLIEGIEELQNEQKGFNQSSDFRLNQLDMKKDVNNKISPMISSNSLTPNQNRFKQIKRLGYNNPTFETIPTTITCQNCGKSLSLEDNFCSRCGTKKSLSSEESFAEIIERNSLISNKNNIDINNSSDNFGYSLGVFIDEFVTEGLIDIKTIAKKIPITLIHSETPLRRLDEPIFEESHLIANKQIFPVQIWWMKGSQGRRYMKEQVIEVPNYYPDARYRIGMRVNSLKVPYLVIEEIGSSICVEYKLSNLLEN
ncbi:CHAT domain-containing protein [Microcystis aeruginosa BLCCF158]|uniref:CHAT domain-containing protein n=1 Tax=Microcystis aeruginosa BLCC-F158 TaxID=2755316 RepID=A0A841UUY0_MICAE|nr:tetratricopeptide repeat protein [Microcystis aeruginosa]MBC1193938.1 CHAT domain-containing protein [Microcystis aeruginosa BLCC-F158]